MPFCAVFTHFRMLGEDAARQENEEETQHPICLKEVRLLLTGLLSVISMIGIPVFYPHHGDVYIGIAIKATNGDGV